MTNLNFTTRWRLPLLILCLLFAAMAFLRLYLPTDAQAGANCSGPYLVDETFANGARWRLCWEQRNLDGVVLRDIYFTPPGGTEERVITQGSISQVHVPYDDNSARFHDITDDGFGNENLTDLTPEECPAGILLKDGAKAAVCQQVKGRGHAVIGLGEQEQGELLSLFSVSTSGEYNYIPVWRFFDDGAIELIMGATGKLQRFTTNSQFGWPVRANNTLGTAHTHNYYWRLDFDLGASGEDDVVEEFNYMANDDAGTANQQRALGVSRFTSESGRSIVPTTLRSWRIRDGVATNEAGRAISYHLEPMSVGHRDVGPSFEPWTANDFYVTKYRDCEKYVSHNPTTGGCGNQLAAFVNGEALTDADVVLWYGVTFHHIPRDEDELYMHAHWDGFRLVPRDWMAANPSAPEITTCAVGDVNCDAQQDATDALFMLQHDVQLRASSAQAPPPLGTLYSYACDVNGDGLCDAIDALLALQCTVKLDNAFCPGIAGLRAAQVTTAGHPSATLTVGTKSSNVTLTGNDQSAQQSVDLQLITPATVGALSLTLTYDPALLTEVTCTTSSAKTSAMTSDPTRASQPLNGWDSLLCHVDPAAGRVYFGGLATQGLGDVGAGNVAAGDEHGATSPLMTVDLGTVRFRPLAASQADAPKIDASQVVLPHPNVPFTVQTARVTSWNAVAFDVDIQMAEPAEQLYLPLIMR